MVETIGKRLCQARLSKGLTIDEAAHATKMRPDKVLALENDDYSRFGNNAYAKGFLQIYGRFLGVDVSEQFHELETPHRVSVDDYQYLNHAPEPPKVRIRTQRKAGPPSVVPLLVFFSFILFAGFAFWIFVNYQRIDPNATGAHSAAAAASSSTPAPAQNEAATPEQHAPEPPAPVHSPAHFAPPSVTPTDATAVASTAPDGVEVRRAEAVPAPTIKRGAEPITPTAGINEIVVEPIKKTWVTIRKGNPDSAPIFEDYLYPSAPPLKLHGTRFFVEVRDQTAVQIRKNGNPIAYQAPGISIQ